MCSSDLVDAGVRAVVVAGSTGEAPALTQGERVKLVTSVRDALPVEVPVIAGTGSASADEAATMTAEVAKAGADAALVLSPLRTGDPRNYYWSVVDAAGDLPVLAYHFPAMSPPGIRVEALPDLRVAGVKDSTGDPDRLLQTLATFDGPVYVGSSALLTMGGAVGCAGAILALANAEPELCIRAFDGDGRAQRKLTAAHFAAKEDFPHGLKDTVAERYGTPTTTRMG